MWCLKCSFFLRRLEIGIKVESELPCLQRHQPLPTAIHIYAQFAHTFLGLNSIKSQKEIDLIGSRAIGNIGIHRIYAMFGFSTSRFPRLLRKQIQLKLIIKNYQHIRSAAQNFFQPEFDWGNVFFFQKWS